MNNLTLSATSNNKYRYKYVFNKNEKFKKEFTNLLLKLGFEEKEALGFWTRTAPTKDGEEEGLAIYPKITYFEDTLTFLENKNYELEIFIGKKKIFIVIRLKNKRQKTREILISNLINSNWIDKKEIESRQKENRRKQKRYLPKHKKINSLK